MEVEYSNDKIEEHPFINSNQDQDGYRHMNSPINNGYAANN